MTIIHGDCITVMAGFAPAVADFALTDPPYVVNYRDRSGRSLRNDDCTHWLAPAFAQLYRVLAPDSYAVSFYGWNRIEAFMAAWKGAGFTPAEHIVFRKPYASSARHMGRTHEQAFLLVKGRPRPPPHPLPDVIDDWRYTGNRLHPTQKPVSILTPLIESLCPEGGTVIDPFCGSGSTLVAARQTGRRYIGIDIDERHAATARARLEEHPGAVTFGAPAAGKRLRRPHGSNGTEHTAGLRPWRRHGFRERIRPCDRAAG